MTRSRAAQAAHRLATQAALWLIAAIVAIALAAGDQLDGPSELDAAQRSGAAHADAAEGQRTALDAARVDAVFAAHQAKP